MYSSIIKSGKTSSPIITSSAASDRLAQTDAGNLNSISFYFIVLFLSFLIL